MAAAPTISCRPPTTHFTNWPTPTIATLAFSLIRMTSRPLRASSTPGSRAPPGLVDDNDTGALARPDPVFNVGGIDVRGVEPRNTPTMINAVFNHRNFWDGRARFKFNGRTPNGKLDPDAKVLHVPFSGAAPEEISLIDGSHPNFELE